MPSFLDTPCRALCDQASIDASLGQANPDLSVVLPDGSSGSMPGVIAEYYEQLGGHVIYFGKPHRPAFAAALELLGPDVCPSRVLHIGDSLLHDIAGANAAGIDSLFVAGGIHHEELGIPEAGTASAETPIDLQPAMLQRAFGDRGVTPTFSTASFVW